MPFGRYTMYNVVGGVCWVIAFLYGGYLFGNVEFIKKNFSLVAVIIILVSLLPPIIAYLKSRANKPEKVNAE